ncbi:fatty acyl-CoA reductase wat-like [Drosophila bipectinata]|uniref:fatty acyl-CoA reductase wat-like n=1 Tax=Drosophila bipectinata TaxID=42026 RepID=UPI001C89ADC8|nr:fatty acyl-CoA reductase wat-like isoform X2 [Drosophila bipectinata]
MDSDIRGFYKDKVIFLTGATGFLGKVIIEKLLRSTDVKEIYTMVRSKRGQNIQDRLKIWQADPIFEVLLRSQPDALQRVHPIAGDCSQPDLGISEQDRKILASEVQVVIHGAATVRFSEPLHVALAINTRATRLMLQLAKEMKKLVAYLHVSTAYSNSVLFRIEEKFYPELLTCGSEKVLALSELVSDQVLDGMEPALRGDFPNTYTYTKALAEDVILKEAGSLPVSIFRPSFIIPTYKEPLVGWIDNLYGPIGMMYGIALGVLRVASFNKNALNSMVPVDYAANVALACSWRTAKDTKKVPINSVDVPPKIYAFGSGNNMLRIEDCINYSMSFREKIPLTQMIWYPFIFNVPSPTLYPLVAFFMHVLPAHVFDLVLRLSGKKPRLIKLYKTIHENIYTTRYFINNTFHFEMENTNRLMDKISSEERIIYDFDMESLNWKGYWSQALYGMRVYLGKDPNTTEFITQAKRRLWKLKIAHYSLVAVFAFLAGYLLWFLTKLFFN